jgi:nitroreductase
MDTLNAIKTRSSVREYSDRPLPKEIIERIVDSGRLAPTARKEEPWEFIAVTDKAELKAIADITDYGKFIKDCACAIVVCCKDTKYYLEDGCAATENMLIAAADLGIGSCWVAGDKKGYCQKILDLLKVPAGYKLVSMISLGYPLKKPKPLEKRPLKEVLHWQRF